MQVSGLFTSVWDGGYEIETSCKIDTTTGLLDIEFVDADEVEVLDREYVSFENSNFEVTSRGSDYYIEDLESFKTFVRSVV